MKHFQVPSQSGANSKLVLAEAITRSSCATSPSLYVSARSLSRLLVGFLYTAFHCVGWLCGRTRTCNKICWFQWNGDLSQYIYTGNILGSDLCCVYKFIKGCTRIGFQDTTLQYPPPPYPESRKQNEENIFISFLVFLPTYLGACLLSLSVTTLSQRARLAFTRFGMCVIRSGWVYQKVTCTTGFDIQWSTAKVRIVLKQA